MVLNNRSISWITNLIAGHSRGKGPPLGGSKITIAITGSFAGFGVLCILNLLFTGFGFWGEI